MKSSLIELFKRARQPKDIRFRSQLYVFLICLGISIFVWFILSLSQEYVTDVKYHLEYVNVPQNRLLRENNTGTVYLKIRSKGFNLFNIKYMTIRNPIVVDLDELYTRKDRESGNHYFLANQLRQQVIGQLDATDQLLSISPDTVFFKLEKLLEVKIPVIPDIELQFSKQYQLYDSMKVEPAFISVSGPESMVDTIKAIYTERKNLNNLNQSKSLTLKLVKPFKSELVSYSEEKVDLDIHVEEFTEAVLERPIEIRDLPPGMRIKTFPEVVKITYRVALKDFQRVEPLMFKIYASPDTDLFNANVRIRITGTESPPFIKITKIEPQEFDYIILE